MLLVLLLYLKALTLEVLVRRMRIRRSLIEEEVHSLLFLSKAGWEKKKKSQPGSTRGNRTGVTA